MIMRYPGGKRRMAKMIVSRLQQFHRPGVEFREPFFGAGAVGLLLIQSTPDLARAWINDADPAIACLWRTTVREPEDLISRLERFTPGIWYFDFFRRRLRNIITEEDLTGTIESGVAVMKLYVHQTSFSGLGTRSGGPLGGRGQGDDGIIGSRYNVSTMTRNIERARGLLTSIEQHPDVCTCLDFEQVIRAPGDSFYYFDPPYYQAGPGLYQRYFTDEDHLRLAEILRYERRPWLLSYDAHPFVQELYRGWATIEQVAVKYSLTGNVQSSELLISNRRE